MSDGYWKSSHYTEYGSPRPRFPGRSLEYYKYHDGGVQERVACLLSLDDSHSDNDTYYITFELWWMHSSSNFPDPIKFDEACDTISCDELGRGGVPKVSLNECDVLMKPRWGLERFTEDYPDGYLHAYQRGAPRLDDLDYL